MIGIKDIASYVPDTVLDNYAQAESFGDSRGFIDNKIGALKLPRKNKELDTSDLAVSAIRKLAEKNSEYTADNIDVIVLVTQNGDGEGLPHTSAIIQDKLNIPVTTAAFDISLGCSGYVYGLFLLKGFMEVSGLKNGLLITADPYSKILDSSDRNTSLLFGDAATVTWMGETPIWNLEYVDYGTDGSGAENLKIENHKLKMNGRQIFNFGATTVVNSIKKFLEVNKIKVEDIDRYFLHQGSSAIVDAISKKFSDVRERFVKDIKYTGNTVSSSIPLLLEKDIFDNKDIQRILICGFGVGLSWATATITRER